MRKGVKGTEVTCPIYFLVQRLSDGPEMVTDPGSGKPWAFTDEEFAISILKDWNQSRLVADYDLMRLQVGPMGVTSCTLLSEEVTREGV